ncbi:toll/interleukin-1 receptor domain-containing protein [Streptosporangium subroseum]|uniref:toll/interleukin-1 receptor domain-containing protein n=1 Tax=Streptosporangium subroseum TaxID=106412 RepID=UPI00308C9973|nr:TIR domain-containing protein [Streptosporangium subroseum]
MNWPKYGFNENPYKYDVCLSFAGEQRKYVETIADLLSVGGMRVFYDDFEKVDLWGKNLYEHLSHVYSQAARFCVLFASKEYASKVWTTHERRSAQERAMGESREYILPVIFDDTKIPGLLSTVAYIDARTTPPEEVAKRIVAKVREAEKVGYVPPNPIALYQTLNLDSKEDKEAARAVAESFARNFSRATRKERRLFFYFILRACPKGRMSNPHVAIETLEREFGVGLEEATETLDGMSSLHVSYSFSSYCHGVPSDKSLYIRWNSADTYTSPGIQAYARNYSNRVAAAMIRATITHICEDCIEELIANLDFSNLANDISETLDRDMPEPDFLPFSE